MPIRSPVFALLALCIVACGAPSTVSPPGEVAASDKQRLFASAPTPDLARTIEGQSSFALDLYKKLASKDRTNLFLSPYSIGVALSMTYAGAHGDTATAFEDVLGIGLAAPAHHRAMNDLDAQLNSRGQGAQGADGQPFRLTTANQLFAQTGFPVEAPFLDTLAVEYGANVRLLDFKSATEPSRQAINDWVKRRTEDRIPELIARGILTDDTRLVLVNAIYFNAAWAQPFKAANTQPGDFHLLDGTVKSASFMHSQELSTRAAQVDGLEVFELGYDGGELSMLVIVPPSGQFESFEQSLTGDRVAQLVSSLKPETLALKLPKFEARSAFPLKDPLSELGLGLAFSGAADFSGISTAAQLAISEVVHQAFVKVNEQGTEAAAATAVVVDERTSVPVARQLVVDRPFVFAIRDQATGALVFIGRVTSP